MSGAGVMSGAGSATVVGAQTNQIVLSGPSTFGSYGYIFDPGTLATPTGSAAVPFTCTATAKDAFNATDPTARYTVTNSNSAVCTVTAIDNLNGTCSISASALTIGWTVITITTLNTQGQSVTRTYRLALGWVYVSPKSVVSNTGQLVWLPQPPAMATPMVKPPGAFDVTTYGADPTGLTDSAAAFWAARTAAQANGAGSVIWVPDGNWLMVAKDPTATHGDNLYFAPGSTPVTMAGTGMDRCFLVQGSNRYVVHSNCDGMTVRDFSIDGASQDPISTVASFDPANGCTVQGIGIIGNQQFAIRWVGKKTAFAVGNVVNDLYVDGAGQNLPRGGDGNETADFDIDFQDQFTATNIEFWGGVHADYGGSGSPSGFYRITGHNYHPTVRAAVNDGWHMTRPCYNVTLTNYKSWGKTGIVGTPKSPQLAQTIPIENVTLDNIQQMVPGFTMHLGDATGYDIKNCSFDAVHCEVQYLATGTWEASNTTTGLVDTQHDAPGAQCLITNYPGGV